MAAEASMTDTEGLGPGGGSGDQVSRSGTKARRDDPARLAKEQNDLWAEFEAASQRPLEVRMRYAFIRTYRPVLDDAEYRSFDSMAEYRGWCEQYLPSWLGYGRRL
jgi:hypothetical protein